MQHFIYYIRVPKLIMAILFIALVIVINWTITSIQIKGQGGPSMRVLAGLLWIILISFYFFPEIDPLHLSWIFMILFVSEIYYLKFIQRRTELYKKDKIKYIKSSSKER